MFCLKAGFSGTCWHRDLTFLQGSSRSPYFYPKTPVSCPATFYTNVILAYLVATQFIQNQGANPRRH